MDPNPQPGIGRSLKVSSNPIPLSRSSRQDKVDESTFSALGSPARSGRSPAGLFRRPFGVARELGTELVTFHTRFYLVLNLTVSLGEHLEPFSFIL